jgi:uncharacterized protein with HEPN domain
MAKVNTARLMDIVEAIALIQAEMTDVTLATLESDTRKRWLVERGLEIISEASRRLAPEMKARHPEIPWPQIASVGNILRHDYERIAYDVIWRLVGEDLPPLKAVCECGGRVGLDRDRRWISGISAGGAFAAVGS